MPKIRVTSTYDFNPEAAKWFIPLFFAGLTGKVPRETIVTFSETGKAAFDSENKGVKVSTEYEVLKDAPKTPTPVIAFQCTDCKLFGHHEKCVHCGSSNTNKVFS